MYNIFTKKLSFIYILISTTFSFQSYFGRPFHGVSKVWEGGAFYRKMLLMEGRSLCVKFIEKLFYMGD